MQQSVSIATVDQRQFRSERPQMECLVHCITDGLKRGYWRQCIGELFADSWYKTQIFSVQDPQRRPGQMKRLNTETFVQ